METKPQLKTEVEVGDLWLLKGVPFTIIEIASVNNYYIGYTYVVSEVYEHLVKCLVPFNAMLDIITQHTLIYRDSK